MKIETQFLADDPSGRIKAADVLKSGGLLAFPTETVYGLGADARDSHAVARIFAAKGRPQFNPLIVHVASIAAAQKIVAWSDDADRLGGAFWPGPLTLVLPMTPNNGIAPLVSAGLPTLAVRVPAHSLAQHILAAFDSPIAAPSANPSGRISSTSAAHVAANLNGKIDAIIDGGPCDVGLESTIIGLFDRPTLLRPGGLPVSAVEGALGTDLLQIREGEPLTAPGQMTSHYAPNAAVRLNARRAEPGEVMLGFGTVEGDVSLSRSGDMVEAAANLFECLHQLDAKNAPIAVAPIPETGLGLAINDRLRRAAADRGPAA